MLKARDISGLGWRVCLRLERLLSRKWGSGERRDACGGSVVRLYGFLSVARKRAAGAAFSESVFTSSRVQLDSLLYPLPTYLWLVGNGRMVEIVV